MKLFWFLILFIYSSNLVGQDEPNLSGGKIPKRTESFFGIHFDLHANENMENLGSGLNEALIDSFLQKVKPDFIQVDCKGHGGISSYPTKIGFKAKSYYGDPMKLWRQITAKNGVALYAHFSGIYDKKVVSLHPEWAVKNPNGIPSKLICSTYSPYINEYLIPQLKELASEYKLNGAWVDGECWAYESDYGEEAANEFRKLSGFQNLPVSQEDPGFFEFMEFQRNLFKNHVRKYIHEVHEEYPDFQITSNWAYSSMMPEKLSIDLDFLSGDLTPGNAVYRAAFESRCLAPQGKPWDIMAWSFSWNPDRTLPRSTKSSIQLCQELSEVMAMGGGVQVYFKQIKDLSVLPWNFRIMKDISQFCRERETFCFQNKDVHDVALLYSGYSYKHQITDVYPEWDKSLESIQGTLNLLLDNQLSVEIQQEHHLRGRMSDYNLIVIPDWHFLDPDFKEELVDYTEKGGKILICGPNSSSLFSGEAGLEVQKEEINKLIYAGNEKALFHVDHDMVFLKSTTPLPKFSPFYMDNDYRQPTDFPSMVCIEKEMGMMGIIPFDLGSSYLKLPHFAKREMLATVLKNLNFHSKIEISGSNLVHTVLRTKNNSLQVHLINSGGNHSDPGCLGFDEIAPIHDIEIEVQTNKKPQKIILQPGNQAINFNFENGVCRFRINKLELYNIVEIL
jgi:hypothetical protein